MKVSGQPGWPAAFHAGQFGEFENVLDVRTRFFERAVAVVADGQGKIFENGLVAKEPAAVLKNHPEAQALAKLFAFVELIEIASEYEMRSRAGLLQAGGCREQVGLACAG